MSDQTPARLRTLIVDDEPLAVERMQVICAELDHLAVVGTASDGGAALRLVEALSPDLLLLDMTMPEMDGLQVARALAGRETRPAVIFVTAHDDFAVEAFDLEAVDYVLKPVTPERLQRAIGRAVARRGSAGAAASEWLSEFWVPHRSELIRIEAAQVERIDAGARLCPAACRGAELPAAADHRRARGAARSGPVHPHPPLVHPAARRHSRAAARRAGRVVGRDRRRRRPCGSAAPIWQK